MSPQYVIFQPSTGLFVAQFVPMKNGQYQLGFVEVAADAVHGNKSSLQNLLNSIDLYRPALADTLMILRLQ
jgi:hypothetical protein